MQNQQPISTKTSGLPPSCGPNRSVSESRVAEKSAMVLEAEASFLAAADRSAGRARALDAIAAFQAALKAAPDNPAHAAGWLRCMRLAKLPPNDAAPVIEGLVARFPRNGDVLTAAARLDCDHAHALAASGNADQAIAIALRVFETLPALPRSTAVGLSLLSVIAAIGDACEQNAAEGDFGARNRLVDLLIERAPAWISALPTTAINKERKRGKEPASPQVRAWMQVRKLLKALEAWEALAGLMEMGIAAGIQNEWVWDAHAEALLQCRRPEEAADSLRSARRQFPHSEALGRRHAAVLHALGRETEALSVLADTALAARVPWPWRDLAGLLRNTGRADDAAQVLRCGLAFEDSKEPGLTWRLHFDLATLLLDAGDEPGAAEELLLARDARIASGWGIGRELTTLMTTHGKRLLPLLQAAEANPTPPEECRGRYREHWNGLMRERAKPAKVIHLKDRFGLVALDGSKEKAMFRPQDHPAGPVQVDSRVLVVTVQSYDTHKKREGRRVVWMAPCERP